MSKKSVVVKKEQVEQVEQVEKPFSVKVEATDAGQYFGRVIKPGEIFDFTGPLHKGRLPLWVKPLEEWKAPVEKEISAADIV